MPLDVLLHTGHCPALDAPPAWGGARGPRGGLPPTEARGVIRPDPHTAHPLGELSHHYPPVPIRAIGFWEAELQRTESQRLPRSAESERIQCWQKCPVNIEALHKCKKLLCALCTRLSVGSITYSKEGCSVLFLIVSIYILSVCVFVWVYVYIGIIFILFYIL